MVKLAERCGPVDEAVAHWFVDEDVDTYFTLLGDGNGHFRTAYCAVAVALRDHSAIGRLGVRSVTRGSGFTQIMTAPATVSTSGVALVVLASLRPLHFRREAQAVQHHPLTRPAAAHAARCLTYERPPAGSGPRSRAARTSAPSRRGSSGSASRPGPMCLTRDGSRSPCDRGTAKR
jgi:hypothetical protein